MKTFLHYIKEKELNENQQLDEFLGGVIGKAGAAIQKLKKNPWMAFLQTGARGKEAAAGALERGAEQEEQKGQLTKDKASCVRSLNYLQKSLNDARSSGSTSRIKKLENDITKVKSECAGVMKASSYDKLAKEKEEEDSLVLKDFNSPVAGKKGFDKYG